VFNIFKPFTISGISSGSGDVQLAKILYNMTTFNTSPTGERTLDNAGSSGSANDAPLYGSKAIYQNGTDNSLPVPLEYTLSATDTKQTATLGADWVDNGSDSYTASSATSDLSDISSTGTNVVINFTISNYSAGTLDGQSANGTYETTGTNEALTAVGFTGDVLINSAKEITSVDTKALLYYSPVNNEWKVIETIPTSTTYTFTDSFADITKLSKVPMASDLVYLNANPDDVRRLQLGVTIDELSFDATDIQDMFPGNDYENGDAVQSLDGTVSLTIVNYVTANRDTYKNTQYGPTDFRFVKDATTGRITGLTTSDSIRLDNSGMYANAQWTPTTPYTIKYKCKGDLMDLGDELHNDYDFSAYPDGTDVTTLTQWYEYGTPTNRTIEDFKLNLISNAENQGARLSVNSTAGHKYLFICKCSGDYYQSGIYSPEVGEIASSDSVHKVIEAGGTTLSLYFRPGDASLSGQETNFWNISIREIKSYTNRTESRKLTYDGIDYRYYVDDIPQASNPQIPYDSILDTKAYIGNPDTIDEIQADLIIDNKIKG